MSQVRRRPAPAAKVEKARPYWWFQGASVDELIRQLTAGPVERLEVHIDAANKATFVVVPQGASADALIKPINESFICPPRCP